MMTGSGMPGCYPKNSASVLAEIAGSPVIEHDDEHCSVRCGDASKCVTVFLSVIIWLTRTRNFEYGPFHVATLGSLPRGPPCPFRIK
jgi:hypothetical protein